MLIKCSPRVTLRLDYCNSSQSLQLIRNAVVPVLTGINETEIIFLLYISSLPASKKKKKSRIVFKILLLTQKAPRALSNVERLIAPDRPNRLLHARISGLLTKQTDLASPSLYLPALYQNGGISYFVNLW